MPIGSPVLFTISVIHGRECGGALRDLPQQHGFASRQAQVEPVLFLGGWHDQQVGKDLALVQRSLTSSSRARIPRAS